MILNILLFIAVFGKCNTDTLKYPIKSGIVDSSIHRSGYHERVEIKIYPRNDPNVYSCTDGEVIFIHIEHDERPIIVIRKDSILYSYMLDTSFVKRGDHINMGECIGRLKFDNSNELNLEHPLLFMVRRQDKIYLKATRYIVF